MNRIIINNRTELSDSDCLKMVDRVVQAGRISKNNEQYCYLSVFAISDGTEIGIATDLRKKSDVFTIYIAE